MSAFAIPVPATTTPPRLTITVCGGGNGGHVSAGLFASQGHTVNVLTRRPASWNNKMDVLVDGSRWENKGDISGPLAVVSDDARAVIPSSDVIIICAPAHTHPLILAHVAPHVKKGAWVGTLFAQGAFDLAARSILGAKTNQKGLGIKIFGFQTIPWTCRTVKYGHTVRIHEAKLALNLAVLPTSLTQIGAALMKDLFQVKIKQVPNFLNLTLVPSNQLIHPARTHAIFRGGRTFSLEEKLPLFYEDMCEKSAETLQGLDDDLQAIRYALTRKYPALNLDMVLPLRNRVVRQYGASVRDPSTLRSTFATNVAYSGIQCPVEKLYEGSEKTSSKEEGSSELEPKLIGYGPPVQSRLFWEDIPFGLCILKNFAELLEIKTPTMVAMIRWHQQYMGIEYLNSYSDLLVKESMSKTGTPFRYGYDVLDELIAPYLPADAILCQKSSDPFVSKVDREAENSERGRFASFEDTLSAPFFDVSQIDLDLDEFNEFRRNYSKYRSGASHGAKGEVTKLT